MNALEITAYFEQFSDNTYFNSYFLEYEMKNYFDTAYQKDCQNAFENIKTIYAKINIAELSEAQ
ncbi:MAG: hypothetical protein JJT94_12340, partial [Bernardetiaceae bacterium]|nr:hypothetical protein [Bernardetiaceae bacterium]